MERIALAAVILERVPDGGINDTIQRRFMELAGPATRQDAHHVTEQGTWQVLRIGLQVRQVDEDRLPMVRARPAPQSGEQVALADPRLTPEGRADADRLCMRPAG